jgi:mycothiol synthase
VTTASTLPTDLTVRPLDFADAAAVTAVTAACELHDDGMVEIEESDVVAEWRRPSFDVARDGIAVLAGDTVVGYAEVYRGRRAEAYVHPDHRGRGIGVALLEWTRQRAAAAGGTLVGQTVTDNNTSAVALFTAHGYTPRWASWILHIPLGPDLLPPALPAGLAIRPLRPGADDAAAHGCIEAAFSEWPDRDPMPYEDWAAGTVHRAGFEPWQLPLVVTGDRVVGAAVLLEYGDEGWVQQLAVHAAYRGRGLGKALLHHAFTVFRARGRVTCGLSTDSRTGALGLYQHVGMRLGRSYRHWARPL